MIPICKIFWKDCCPGVVPWRFRWFCFRLLCLQRKSSDCSASIRKHLLPTYIHPFQQSLRRENCKSFQFSKWQCTSGITWRYFPFCTSRKRLLQRRWKKWQGEAAYASCSTRFYRHSRCIPHCSVAIFPAHFYCFTPGS